METILRSCALAIIDNGEPFTMEFVQADRRRGTGGQLIKVENWVKVAQPPVKETILGQLKQTSAVKKAPDHYGNGTINIQNPGNKALHIHKVHTVLIQTFNGKKIING